MPFAFRTRRCLLAVLAAGLAAAGGTAAAQNKNPPVQTIKILRDAKQTTDKGGDHPSPAVTGGKFEFHSADKDGAAATWRLASGTLEMGKNTFGFGGGLLGEVMGDKFTAEDKKKYVIVEVWFKGAGPGGARPSPSPVGYGFFDREQLQGGRVTGRIEIRQDPGKGTYYIKGVQAKVRF